VITDIDGHAHELFDGNNDLYNKKPTAADANVLMATVAKNCASIGAVSSGGKHGTKI